MLISRSDDLIGITITKQVPLQSKLLKERKLPFIYLPVVNKKLERFIPKIRNLDSVSHVRRKKTTIQ